MNKTVAAVLLGFLLACSCTAQQRHGYSVFRETLVDLSWPEVKKLAASDAIVLVPICVIEEHGPHLSLGTDTYLAYDACRNLRSKLAQRNVTAVIAPPVYWGIMQLGETGDYPGSFTVSPATMKALLTDIFTDLHRWGFRRIFCLNRHGDRLHRQTLREAIDNAKKTLHLEFYDERGGDDSGRPDIARHVTGKLFQPDYHAGAPETSLMLKVFPEEVNTGIADTLKPENGFHPRGYAGDPGNYRAVDMQAYENEEMEYDSEKMARWANKTRKK